MSVFGIFAVKVPVSAHEFCNINEIIGAVFCGIIS